MRQMRWVAGKPRIVHTLRCVMAQTSTNLLSVTTPRRVYWIRGFVTDTMTAGMEKTKSATSVSVHGTFCAGLQFGILTVVIETTHMNLVPIDGVPVNKHEYRENVIYFAR